MNSPWHRSRLTWIGAIVMALLLVGWWLSEHHAAVTTFRQARHYHEFGHQFGGLSFLGSSRPSALARQKITSRPYHIGNEEPDVWARVIDSMGFAAWGAGSPVTVQSRTGIRYIPEEEVALAGWFPGPTIKQGDGWWFLFIPYWLIILIFPVLWFCLVRAWQRRKRRRSPL